MLKKWKNKKKLGYSKIKQAEVYELKLAELCLLRCIRFIFTYNRWESTRFLRQQMNRPNITEIFHARKQRFSDRNKQSDNSVIRYLSTRSV